MEPIKHFKREGNKFFFSTPNGVTTVERTKEGEYEFGGVEPLNVILILDVSEIKTYE